MDLERLKGRKGMIEKYIEILKSKLRNNNLEMTKRFIMEVELEGLERQLELYKEWV